MFRLEIYHYYIHFRGGGGKHVFIFDPPPLFDRQIFKTKPTAGEKIRVPFFKNLTVLAIMYELLPIYYHRWAWVWVNNICAWVEKWVLVSPIFNVLLKSNVIN